MESEITQVTAWLFDQQGSSDELERKIVEHCVDPNTQSTAGESLLFLACSGGQETLTTALLRLRANPSVANREGVTPLAASIQKGHASIVQALLKAGVSVEDQHISMAAKQGDVFLCQVLLENDNYALVDKCEEKDGQSPLYTATLAQHYSLVCFLLEKKASPGVVTRDTGNTPLHAAVKQKNIRICKLLMAFGAPVNYPSLRGYTPLHIAAFVGNTDVIQILIQNGANIKAQVSKVPISGVVFTCYHRPPME